MNLLASLPLTILGLALARLFIPDEINAAVRSVHGVAIPLIGFGILLGLADIYGKKTRTLDDLTPWHAMLIGAVQVIAAILPGTSRSGITMTTARALGYSRPDAAKFGMLVGAPVLTAVGLYMIAEFYFGSEAATVTVTAAEAIAIGVGSALSGLVAIYILMALVRRMSFLPFVAYRILLGIALLTMMPIPLVAG
jgi:undecaprenyl-diphosphatase